MNEIMDSSFLTSTATVTIKLFSKRKSFKYWFNRIFKKKIKIIIYGDSGVGKTQFIKTITGKDEKEPSRTRMTCHYDLILRTGRKVILIDTPGHKTNQIARNSELDELTRGHIDGIINLVDYGYQDSSNLQQHKDTVFKLGTSEVKPEFLNENRKREIERSNEFINRITASGKIKWIITVINKADVWDKERETVLEYYEIGEFRKIMEHLQGTITQTICPFCSIIKPFCSTEMVLTYSEMKKADDYENLLVNIEECIQNYHHDGKK